MTPKVFAFGNSCNCTSSQDRWKLTRHHRLLPGPCLMVVEVLLLHHPRHKFHRRLMHPLLHLWECPLGSLHHQLAVLSLHRLHHLQMVLHVQWSRHRLTSLLEHHHLALQCKVFLGSSSSWPEFPKLLLVCKSLRLPRLPYCVFHSELCMLPYALRGSLRVPIAYQW